MENKVLSYLGFAAKARKLVTGYNTCNVSAAEKHKVPCKIYGAGEQLSRITGNAGKGIFGITDENFAKVISDGIDHIQSEQ